MAKKSGQNGHPDESAIATIPQNETALATSQYVRTGYGMEGEDSDDQIMPRVIVHQGDISEKYYGEHKKGTLLDSVSMQPIPSLRFTPIGIAWKEFVRWDDERGAAPVYRTRNKAEVPPEDLRWTESNGKRIPPAAEITRNFLVLFEGSDSPVCLSLKEKDKKQRAAGKALNQMEKIRSVQRKPPGLYELVVETVSNDQGQWQTLSVRPVGDPNKELLDLGLLYYQALSTREVVVHDSPDDTTPSDDGYDPNSDG